MKRCQTVHLARTLGLLAVFAATTGEFALFLLPPTLLEEKVLFVSVSVSK